MEMIIRTKQLNSMAVKYVVERLEAVLKPLAEELGVALTLGEYSFRPNNARFQLKLHLCKE